MPLSNPVAAFFRVLEHEVFGGGVGRSDLVGVVRGRGEGAERVGARGRDGGDGGDPVPVAHLHVGAHVLGRVQVVLHDVPLVHGLVAVLVVVVEVGRPEGVEHLVAQHPHAAGAQGGLELEVVGPDALAVDLGVHRIEGPHVGPEEVAPSTGRALDHEADVVHLPVPVDVQVEVRGNLGRHRVHGVAQQGVLPDAGVVVVGVAAGVGEGVEGLVVAPGVRVLVGEHGGTRRHGVEGGVDGELAVGGGLVVGLHGVGARGGVVEHVVVGGHRVRVLGVVAEPDEDDQVVQDARGGAG